MNNITTKKTSVKLAGNKHSTILTINWGGVSEKQMQDLAEKTLIISWQRVMKQAAQIPQTSESIDALQYLSGSSSVTIDPMTALRALSPEKLAQLLKEKGIEL